MQTPFLAKEFKSPYGPKYVSQPDSSLGNPIAALEQVMRDRTIRCAVGEDVG